MEALHERLTTGEQSGGQEQSHIESPPRGSQPKSPSQPHQQQQTGSPKPPSTAQQHPKKSRRQHERKRLRHQRQSIDSDTAPGHKQETATKATTVSSLSSGVPSSSVGDSTQSTLEAQEGAPKQKRERKPQRPGKYVCTYCGRACAKPSVLQKHIRSHTGERPYPCAPCGFSFKTKSNLYKHRKSHTHRVKAGLALGESRSLEEQITDSEDETKQLSSASSHTETQGGVASVKTHETDKAKDCTGGSDDSYAVKKRLALRLSRGKHGLRDSSDEKTSSLISGSRGSTESGYFSRSESTEQSQDSPPNTSAKSYAEIILGKYGRLGHLQRMSRHHNQQPPGQEDKSIPFTVPKKQVIDHITKLITINEAVVDTSKIDSVKPRRFSLSRKNSSESQKSSLVKEPLINTPKAGDLGYRNSGSITMGVPCQKFHNPSNVEKPAGQTSIAPLVRSHSMPSAVSSIEASSGGPSKFRLSQSFDEQQPASRRYGMLRRQPAIEIPLGSELTEEKHEVSHSFYSDNITTVSDQKQSQPQPYECEACGTGCKDWEGYKKHKQSPCLANHPRNEGQTGFSPFISHTVRAGASAMRKRRKEESFEFDNPSSPSSTSPALLSGHYKNESNVACEGPSRPTLQTCSVIQHTSSFEKQESMCNENQGTEAIKNSPLNEEYQLVSQKQPQQNSTKVPTRKLVRQHSVKVPEILVTEDSNMSTEASLEPAATAKQSDKPEEFQWPQRSPSLAQLPIEKLPPKKKRLRLAEAAQSSGESSFDSISLPHSPSQDSSSSFASSRSASFEESNKLDMETASSTPLRRSRAAHMLTVPGVHQQREMRRSASEQAPHDTQSSVSMAETRSKSFDYSCLSPERSAVGWRERRKCLLMRHTAVRDPDEEEEELSSIPHCSPEYVSPSKPSQTTPTSVYCTRSPASPSSEETALHSPVRSHCKEGFSQWKLSQNIQLTGGTEPALTYCTFEGTVKQEVPHVHTGQPPPPAPQLYPTHGAASGAARARYLPMSTGLRLEIPSLHDDYPDVRLVPPHPQQPVPRITSSPELLRPVPSQAVAVRHQTDTLTQACAIYTTLSQSTSPVPKERLDATSHNIGIPTADPRNTSPDLQLWSDDGLRIPCSGGNKRMLSPSNSIEVPLESQQQQKRVKEEETEAGCADRLPVNTGCCQGVKAESQSGVPGVCPPATHLGTSIPSLQSSTCNSWCYLNYVKPNPSALDEQKPSVYSSWSTGGYDPNPPGLSSKTALSLLHCKQRLSPSIYTVSPMSASESMEQECNKKPSSPDVHSSPPYCREDTGTGTERLAAEDNGPNTKEKMEEKTETPKVWTSEKGSDEEQSTAHSGEGGKCQCKDPPSYSCKHCHVSLHVKGVSEGCSIPPREEKAAQCSDPGPGGRDGDNDTEEEEGRRDEDDRSKMAELSHPATEPEEANRSSKDSVAGQSSASSRRALFARRHLDASASTWCSSGGSRSQSTHSPRDPPKPGSQSPGPRLPPTAPSSPLPSSCPDSSASSALRPVSPIGGLFSPAIVRSSGPPGAPADSSARCHACLHPRDQQPSTARRPTEEVSLTHIAPSHHPTTRPRGAQNLLSHLPLHSQQPGRAPNHLIPIGGIHMIQPRSPLPMYRLLSGPPAAASAGPGGASWKLVDPPKERVFLPQHPRDALKATSSLLDPGGFGGSSGTHRPPSPETEKGLPEGNTERCVHPETTQGQK